MYLLILDLLLDHHVYMPLLALESLQILQEVPLVLILTSVLGVGVLVELVEVVFKVEAVVLVEL